MTLEAETLVLTILSVAETQLVATNGALLYVTMSVSPFATTGTRTPAWGLTAKPTAVLRRAGKSVINVTAPTRGF